MRWWRRLRRTSPSLSVRETSERVRLILDGWREVAPVDDLRIWRDSCGDVLSLATPGQGIDLPQGSEEVLRNWCRELARGRGGGLIEAHQIGSSAKLIYKRLEMPGYIYTGMFITSVQAVPLVWTVVAGEHGITGEREALVTANLMNAGKLTIEDYRNSFAQDPYEPAFGGVERSVLRFMSDDECYDERFPHHPLSRVRRVLAILPENIQVDAHAVAGLS